MTQEIKKGYKLCSPSPSTKELGLYYSAFTWAGRNAFYYKGQWTKRPEKCGPLAVFDELMCVLRFKTQWKSEKLIVLECEYKPSEEKTLYCSNYYDFCRNKRIFKETTSENFPEGTVLADEVKIIKEIKNEEARF